MENVMGKSKQQTIKELILELLKDGKPRQVREIYDYLDQKGIYIDRESSALRTALHALKNEFDSMKNPEKGVYVWEENKSRKNFEREYSYDFSDFVTVHPSTKRNAELVVSIMPDGTFAVNTHLLNCLSENKAEVKIKNDGSQLVLIADGKESIKFGKNGRIKNYEILKKLQMLKKKLPVYYVGEWNAESGIWIGNISTDNPNRPRKNRGL